MAGRAEGIAWKVIGLSGAITAGVIAKMIINATWKAASGEPPPANPEHPEVQWPQALAFAVASGAAIGVARMLASRQLAKTWRKSTGHLPPGTREVS